MIGLRSVARISLAVALLAGSAADAQDAQPEMNGDKEVTFVPKDAPGIVLRFEIPDWSSAEIQRIGAMLVGSWKSDEPIDQSDGSGDAVHAWIHIAHTHIDGLDDVLYIEAHRDDAGERPYRQSFAQLYSAAGKVRLRTLEPVRMASGLDPFAGFWAIPDQFPLFSRKDVLATMDIELTDRGSVFEGKSLHRYPTDLLGATEMASEIRFDGNSLAIADRGFGAEGNQAWGPEPGEWTTFSRGTYGLDVEQSPNGLTILTYPTEQGDVPRDGQLVRFAYSSWLYDTGRRFASSDEDGVMPEITWPVQPKTMNWAWEEVVQDSRLGMVKRFIAPAERAYRMRGWAAKGVPPMARIVFHMECIAVEDPPEPGTEVGDAGG